MGAWDNSFEKKWTILFLFFYFFIMIPFPFYYSETYIPSFFGVPSFIYGWLVHAIIVLIFIVIFAKKALQRPEYQETINEQNH